eukprot:COSAG02_NODE_45_length_45811_cov_83.565891_21_plen_77_part_00
MQLPVHTKGILGCMSRVDAFVLATRGVALPGWAWVHEHLHYTNVVQLAMRMLENATVEHESAIGKPKCMMGYKLPL